MIYYGEIRAAVRYDSEGGKCCVLIPLDIDENTEDSINVHLESNHFEARVGPINSLAQFNFCSTLVVVIT